MDLAQRDAGAVLASLHAAAQPRDPAGIGQHHHDVAGMDARLAPLAGHVGVGAGGPALRKRRRHAQEGGEEPPGSHRLLVGEPAVIAGERGGGVAVRAALGAPQAGGQAQVPEEHGAGPVPGLVALAARLELHGVAVDGDGGVLDQPRDAGNVLKKEPGDGAGGGGATPDCRHRCHGEGKVETCGGG